MTLDLPTFFIDRDLGRKAFPEGLRSAGIRVVTSAEHYGIEECALVFDETWILEAAGNGWPAFCCDAKHRKRRRPAERPALLESGLREFILNGKCSGPGERQESTGQPRCDSDRLHPDWPFVYRVHPTRLERLRL